MKGGKENVAKKRKKEISDVCVSDANAACR